MAENSILDRTDRQILRELQQDARIPMRDLADIVGAAPATCSERIRRLVSRGLITGFHADVALTTLGRPVQALVFAQIRPLNRDLISRFHDEALEMPEVIAVFVLAGGDDFLLHVAVRDVAHLHSFLVDKLSSRREIVQFRSSVVFSHGRKRAPEDLNDES